MAIVEPLRCEFETKSSCIKEKTIRFARGRFQFKIYKFCSLFFNLLSNQLMKPFDGLL